LTVSESTGAGGDLGINGDHIDILKQSAPSKITEDGEKFAGGFAAKFSGFFQAAVAKINGLFSLVKGCQDEEAALEERIEEEAGAREAGDEGLLEGIGAEAGARETADAGLQEAIDTEAGTRETADEGLQEAIEAEAGARETADEGLQEKIDGEAATRETADTALEESIDAEVSGREAGDAALQTKIETEASERGEGDSALQTKINNEAATREAWDEVLQEAIDAEASEREAADAEKVNIADVETGYTPEGTLQIAGITGETEMNDAEEIALYTHHLKIRVMNGTTFVIWFGLELFLNENTPFTAETFWQWLADQGYISEETSKPINGRYTTDGQSSLDAGAVWTNAAATQIIVTTIASSGTAVQTIPLSGKTTTVNDFVKEAPFNIAAHRHGFRIEDMSGGFVGTPATRVMQAKASAG
jgi:hypothetical protein